MGSPAGRRRWRSERSDVVSRGQPGRYPARVTMQSLSAVGFE
jgi:hypothetical protein